MATFASLCEGLRYGFRLGFALQLEGCSSLLIERTPTGAVAPTGHTLVEGLTLDDSAPIGERVDRMTGIGQAFDLSFKIGRSATTEALFARPSKLTELAEDLAFGATTEVEVKSTSGWASSGELHIGREMLTYSSLGTGGDGFPAFLGIQRGMPNSLWRGYDYTQVSAISTWVTSTPLYWRGRLAKLWAYYIDPFGRHHETDLLTGAALVWQGHIDEDPEPYEEGWVLTGRSYGRRLAEPLASGVSGKALITLDDDPTVEVDPELTIWIRVTLPTAVIATLTPYAAYSAGDKVRASQARDLIKAAWDASALASDPDIGNLAWHEETTEIAPGGGLQRRWVAKFPGRYDGTLVTVWFSVAVRASILGGVRGGLSTVNNLGNHASVPTVWTSASATADALIVTPLHWLSAAEVATLRVVLDEGDPTELPATGWVRLETGDEHSFYLYSSIETQGAEVEVVIADGPSLATFLADTLEEVYTEEIGVAFVYRDNGPAKDLMRRMLMSSGRADNDGTYDTLPIGQGYDLDGVDTASFDDELDGAWELMSANVGIDDEVSFEGLWGKLLALSGRALVPLSDGSAVKLTMVRTSVYDTADTVATITDADLVVSPDGGQPAVRSLRPIRTANSIEVKLKDFVGEDRHRPLYVNDRHSQRASGTRRLSLDVIGIGRAGAHAAIRAWASDLFGELVQRPYEIDVPPWVDVQTGDAIRLDSAHFRLRNPSTATLGYTGTARVIGREVVARTHRQTLTVVLQGVYTAITLSPSAAVVSYSGTATVADVIRVSTDYTRLMAAYLVSSDPFRLVTYTAGADTNADGYTIDDVTEAGGLCELQIASVIGSPTLAAGDYLTLDTTTLSNDAQDLHLHTDTTGALWR